MDTIAAICTALSPSGIGIIRVSGESAIEITDKIFKSPDKKTLAESKTHTIHYGHIYDGDEIVDEVLVMTVHPGYGGQKFIADCLPKVSWVRERYPSLDIMVDGGVNGDTAEESVKAGANQLVAGSYLFRQSDMAAAVADMRMRCAC